MKESYYKRNKESILNRLNEKYKSDFEFREKVKSDNKLRYKKDTTYRQNTINRAKERYRNNKKSASNLSAFL